MIRKKETYSYIMAFIAMIAMSIAIYLLTSEDENSYSRVLNSDSFIAKELEFSQENFTDTHKLESEIEKVKLEIAKTATDLQNVNLEYTELSDEMKAIKDNLNWLNKTTTFGAYTRNLLQELPKGINIQSLHDYRSQVNLRFYEITKASRASDSLARDSSNLKKLQELMSLYKQLSTEVDKLIDVSENYSVTLETAIAFLKERQVWTYSNTPLWESIFNLNGKKLFGVIYSSGSSSKNIDWSKMNVALIFLAVFSLTLLFLNWWLKLKLDLISQRQEKIFGHPLKDSFSNSIIVLLITVLASSMLPIFFFNCVWFLDFMSLRHPSIFLMRS